MQTEIKERRKKKKVIEKERERKQNNYHTQSRILSIQTPI